MHTRTHTQAHTHTVACTTSTHLLVCPQDLDADWKQNHSAIMPNLSERLKRGGLSFDNHVAALPVCGPSRSSLLLGRYPHNTGYFDNCDAVSMANFRSKQNDTIGRWLAKSGYHTAFLGKYVNCLEYDVPSGWSHWGGFRSSGNTYNSYNATMYTVD
eukprot:SAG31_NODE_12175_length_961_cov_1.272622_1_plen_156_part_01